MSMPVTRQLEPWSHLNDKVVLVTGASSGIGKEFCIDSVKSGCKIVAAARRVDQLKSLCDEINRPGSNSDLSGTSLSELRAMAVALDVTSDGASIEAAVKEAWNAFGRIDVLINNAGVRGSVHSPLNLTEEEWKNTIKTNLTGSWLVSKYVCSNTCDAKLGGSVINISSIDGLTRAYWPGSLVYAASKAALNTLTKRINGVFAVIVLGIDIFS